MALCQADRHRASTNRPCWQLPRLFHLWDQYLQDEGVIASGRHQTPPLSHRPKYPPAQSVSAFGLKHIFQILTRMAAGMGRDDLGRTCGHNHPATVAAFGANINHPIGGFDNV